MILFLYGEDTYRSRQYLRQSIEQFKKQRDPQGYNVVFLDGKKEPLSKLVAEMKSSPFLAEKRMILIENVLANGDKTLLAALTEIVEDNKLPESNVIIFWQGEPLCKVKEAKELQAQLLKLKFAQEFSVLTGPKLHEWIKKEFEKNKVTIEPAALDFLAFNAADMWQLHSLVEQLSAYRMNAAVTQADVALFLDTKTDDNVFNLIEALIHSDKRKAYQLLYGQREAGQEDGKLFGLLVWQFRILLSMVEALDRDPALTSDALAGLLKIHPFVAKKNLAAARRFRLPEITRAYRELLDIDIKTKTGQGDQGMMIDVFVQSV